MVQVVPILLMISGSSYGEFILEVISTKDLIGVAKQIRLVAYTQQDLAVFFPGKMNIPGITRGRKKIHILEGIKQCKCVVILLQNFPYVNSSGLFRPV